jgi:hypothetical protein
VGYKFQFWVPVSMQERFDSGGYKLEDRGERWIEGFPPVPVLSAVFFYRPVRRRRKTEAR